MAREEKRRSDAAEEGDWGREGEGEGLEGGGGGGALRMCDSRLLMVIRL